MRHSLRYLLPLSGLLLLVTGFLVSHAAGAPLPAARAAVPRLVPAISPTTPPSTPPPSCGSPGEPCDPQNRPYFRQFADATRGQIAKIVYLSRAAGAACGTR